MNEQYRKELCLSTSTEPKAETGFVVLLLELKGALPPLGGAVLDAGEADLDNTTTGESGHYGCHGL